MTTCRPCARKTGVNERRLHRVRLGPSGTRDESEACPRKPNANVVDRYAVKFDALDEQAATMSEAAGGKRESIRWV